MPESPILDPYQKKHSVTSSIGWCLAAVIFCALMTGIGVKLPSRFKLLGLFPLVWGALTGIALRWIADEFPMKRPRWTMVVVAFLIAAVEAGVVLGGWIAYRSDLKRQFERIPALNGLQLTVTESPKAIARDQSDATEQSGDSLQGMTRTELEAVIRERQHVQMSLESFLFRRILRLGEFSRPWPEVFWGCEIVFGTLAGVWCWGNIKVSNRIERE